MQIVNKSYFNKENYLHVPMSAVEPTGSETPNNVNHLDSLCISVEKDILLNAFGLVLYRLFYALTEASLELPENERFKKLINGEDYDDNKTWEGLKNDYSLIAYRVYEQFTSETNIRLSATGATKVDAEKAKSATPVYLIATANQRFIKAYQGSMSNHPYRYENFTDYYGCNSEPEKNLYQYMLDKKDDFPEWKPSMFKFYETVNSFGI